MCCVGVGGVNAEHWLQSPQAVLWHFRGQAAPSLKRDPAVHVLSEGVLPELQDTLYAA